MLQTMSSKNIWRARMLQTRSELGPDKTSQLNRDICKQLSFVWIEGGGLGSSTKPVWAAYKSFRWEADADLAVQESSLYIQWAYPRISAQTQELEFRIPNPTDARWLKNAWGIWEPDPLTSTLISINDAKGVLVPAVAFDRNGRRLGYGKGFYDRALNSFKGLKVGVAFSVQVTSESLPCEDLDVPMDLIVTESEIIRISDLKADKEQSK